VIDLAKESDNDLVEVYHKGTKIIEMNRKIYTYESDIPNNLNILGLLHLQFLIWKINRMSKKVPTLDPKDSELGYYWDTMSTQTWIDDNIKIDRVKVMVEVATRSIFGAEPCEISFLFFLWYVHQNKDFDNLINIKNGLQGFKTKLGTQHMSKYLQQQI
jgi:monoamine oxidase